MGDEECVVGPAVGGLLPRAGGAETSLGSPVTAGHSAPVSWRKALTAAPIVGKKWPGSIVRVSP